MSSTFIASRAAADKQACLTAHEEAQKLRTDNKLRAARPNDSRPQYCLNMVGVPKRPEIPFKDFSEALGAEPVASRPRRSWCRL